MPHDLEGKGNNMNDQKSVSDMAPDDWECSKENPRNWTTAKKWTTMSVVSLYALLAPLGSSMMAPALLQVSTRYDITNDTILAMTLSIFLLSFALGSLTLPPLSEMYGRKWLLHLSNIAFAVFNLVCAFAPTTGTLIAFRLLSGYPGAGPVSIGGGCVADLFREEERASAMALYTLGPLVGPVIGPVIGGYVAEELSVKYVFIIVSAACGVAALVGLPLLRETYAPVLRRRLFEKADPEKASAVSTSSGAVIENKWGYLWTNMTRPATLLFTSLICFALSLYMAFLYGIYYLMFAVFASFFRDTYGFSAGQGGLCYLGLGVGFFASTAVSSRFGDQVYNMLCARNGGVGKPEFRIPSLIFGSFFIPISLFWYGWSAEAKMHWIMPIIGTGIFGFGLMLTFLPIQLYLVDAFHYAASAFGAGAVFRCLCGFAFPLFGKQMYDVLGMGIGNTLLGVLAIVLGIPFPVYLYFYGEGIRKRSNLHR
ncbi:major facilitator superfamily domain-containing protein [Schizophyllum amplum]|uniref:Major facilitator superfamily domain-containing protein n=1 Tax=Schizophyllum amplum TaxID=97359 RepID=A0A550CT33_9AGAR|nr:major facilitator superfamily domain-containing protein [Auriculariopsis ampla]